MARKAKKRVHQMPRLSALDLMIYWAVFLLLCVSYFILIVGTIFLRNRIAFFDLEVVAVEDNISIFWLFIPWLTFFLMTFLLWLLPYQNRQPIFGLRNFKYGPPAWPKRYPLFMKNKPYVYVSERKKKDRRKLAVFLLVVLLIGFIPYPWSLYGRDNLKTDGSIVQYNMFNKQWREYSPEDFRNIQIETYRYRTGKTGRATHWGVRMIFITDSGKKYSFDHTEFRKDEHLDIPYWLVTMQSIKKRYDPAIISYEGAEDLELVIQDRKLSQEAIEMLYHLFGQTG